MNLLIDINKKMIAKTNNIKNINCSNCGNGAEKITYHEMNVIETTCSFCDYLLIQSLDTGRVMEAYAPGLIFTKKKETFKK